MNARERAHAMFPVRLRAALLLAASLAALLGGCSASPRGAEAPAMARAAPEAAPEAADDDPGARAEITRLWDEIDAWRGQAGTAEIAAGYAQRPGPEPAGAGEAMPGGESPGEAAAAGTDPGRVSASLRSPDAACPATASEPPECRDSCTLATSICDNAGRICRLAQQLAGDDWAAGKCTDAGAVCRQATADCCGCRADH